MRRFIILVMILVSSSAGCVCGHSAGNPELKASDFSSRQTRAPGEYLVTLVHGTDKEIITGLYGRFGIRGIKDLGNSIFLVTLTDDPGPEKMEELRGQNSQVKAVQPNFMYRTNGTGSVK